MLLTGGVISGSYAVVGSRMGANNNGSAYVFERDSNVDWVQTTTIVASDGADGDYFGNVKFHCDK